MVLSSNTLSGDFTEKVLGFSDAINNLRVGVEGEIDFSDEGEGPPLHQKNQSHPQLQHEGCL